MDNENKNNETTSNESIKSTQDSMRTASATIPSPFPEFGDGSGYTTYSNVSKTETTPQKDTSPYDIESGSGYDDPPKPAANNGKVPFEIEYGTDENQIDLKKETRDRNNEANKGFDPKVKFSKEGQRFIEYEMLVSENAKLEEQNKALMEQNRLMMDRMNKMDAKYNMLLVILTQNNTLPPVVTDPSKTTPYVQDPALAAALDPNKVRPLNPLEEVQKGLLVDQNKKQADFAKQVEEERRLHDPLYKSNTATTNPELEDTTAKEAAEKKEAEEKMARNLKRLALIGGVVGATTGVLAGATVAIPAAAVCGVTALVGRGLDWFGGIRMAKLEQQKVGADKATLDKIDKRIAKWEKVKKGCKYISSFLGGAAIGFGLSGMAMNALNGGHGLIWNTPEPTTAIPGGDASGSLGRPSTETPIGNGGEPTNPTGPETYQGNDFIDKNGQVHASGSPWDNTHVAEPVNGLSAENPNNYVQGPWGKTPSVVQDFLNQHNVTDTTYLDGFDRDRILDETWLQIKGGNTNPDMVEILKHIGTEGTKKLLTVTGN